MGRKCDILKARGPRFVTVCNRRGVTFFKSSVYIRYRQPLISKDYNNNTNTNNTNTIINCQQILVVIFEFTGAARGFMIISCAARGVKKVGQH